MLPVDGVDRFQSFVDVTRLQLPSLTAVGCLQDRPAVTDGPTHLPIDKANIVQIRIPAE
jgi:hypothetical protein